jgi:hypothetical protein
MRDERNITQFEDGILVQFIYIPLIPLKLMERPVSVKTNWMRWSRAPWTVCGQLSNSSTEVLTNHSFSIPSPCHLNTKTLKSKKGDSRKENFLE